MRAPCVVLLSLTFVAPAAAAEKKFDPEARAKSIAPYLDEQTFTVIHVDLMRVDAEALATKIADWTKEDRKTVEREMASFRQGLAAFKQAGGTDVFVVFSLADLPDLPFVVVPLPDGGDGQALLRFREQLRLFPAGTAEKIGRAVVAGSKDAVARVRDLKAVTPPALGKAFAAAGDTTAQFLLLPNATSRKIVEQMLPTLPKELGGGPSTTLTRGLQWAAVGTDATPKGSLRLVVQSQDAQAAQKLHAWVGDVFKNIREPQLAQLTPKVAGDRLTLTAGEEQLVAAVLPAIQKVRTAAGRAQSTNNLKQLALAMHNYHDKHRTFPPQASRDRNGRPLLSWRVLLLPYLDQDALFKEFHLDEPWDSEHNRKLLAQMPAVYNCPLSKVGGEHKTVYLVPVGKDTIFPPASKGIRFADITDGTSNTILIVEAADSRAVPWTKPEDLKVDAKQPLAGLTDGRRKVFPTAFADGSIHFLATAIDPQTLWALFTRNGGEVAEIPP